MRRSILTLLLILVIMRPASAEPSGRRVLVVLSSEDHITLRNGVRHPTGLYMNELLVPLRMLVDAGYEPVFATPKGNAPTLDAHSNSAASFGNDMKKYEEMKKFLASLSGLRNPRKLSDVAQEGLTAYSAVFVPGGHAPMQDLVTDPSMGTILRAAHARGMPTALICHGPIALISTLPEPVKFIDELRREEAVVAVQWPYREYRMTIFSTAEEQTAEKGFLGGKVLFYPDRALEAAGGNVTIAPAFTPHVIVDRELITGQNPASDEALGRALLEALKRGS